MAVQPGYIGKVFANGIELPSTGYEITDKANAKDVSNTRDGRKRIATLPDAEGSIKLYWDEAQQPTNNPPNLRKGTELTFQCYTSVGKFFLWTGLVDEVTISSEIEGVISYNCKVLQSAGSVVYPA
jgi:hypothetical protein